MTKVILSTIVAGLVVFTGCSQKAAEAATAKETKAPEVKPAPQDNMVNLEAERKAIQDKLVNIYFDFDKYNIRKDQEPNVANNIEVIKSGSKFNYKIEGNCDEWGTDEYNYALGLKRATTVKNALVTAGIKEDKLTIISYGESNPVCTEKNKECWQKNRRVEIKVLP